MEEIENEFLRVSVDKCGGALSRVFDKRRNAELLWQGAENSWKGHDVVIFPFVARLKNKTYTHGGKEYFMDNHGLVRYSVLDTLRRSKTALTLGLKSNAETLKRYPFDFDFSVSYKLDENSLHINYRIENTGKERMFFAVGAHPAYAVDCDEKPDFDDMRGNEIAFEATQKPVRYVLDEAGEYIVSVTEPYKLDGIELDKKLFDRHKTLIYGGIEGGVKLIKRDGSEIAFDIGGAPYLAVWSHARHGGYVCVEPWWGLSDFENCDSEIANKRGIRSLESGETFECGYSAIYN